MPAAVSGSCTLVGDHHWTSGPVAIVPAALHAAWVASFTKADSTALGRLKKRVARGPDGGVMFPRFDVVGCYRKGSTITFVEAYDATGRYPTPLEPVLKAAPEVEVTRPWKQIDTYRVDEPHVLCNAWAKNLGGGAADRRRSTKLALASGDYVIEEIRGVTHAVQAAPNKRPIDVTYAFTRIRPVGEVPRPTKAKPAPPLGPTEVVASPAVVKAGKKLRFVGNDQTCTVIMPRSVRSSWSGLDDDSNDYARACAVNGVGLIDVGGRKALVIGMDSSMAFHPTPTGGLVCLWIGADTSVGVLASVLAIPDTKWKTTKLAWDVGDGKLVMIGAPTSGRVKKAGAAIDLAPGRYSVETCWSYGGDVRVGSKLEDTMVAALRLSRCK